MTTRQNMSTGRTARPSHGPIRPAAAVSPPPLLRSSCMRYSSAGRAAISTHLTSDGPIPSHRHEQRQREHSAGAVPTGTGRPGSRRLGAHATRPGRGSRALGADRRGLRAPRLAARRDARWPRARRPAGRGRGRGAATARRARVGPRAARLARLADANAPRARRVLRSQPPGLRDPARLAPHGRIPPRGPACHGRDSLRRDGFLPRRRDPGRQPQRRARRRHRACHQPASDRRAVPSRAAQRRRPRRLRRRARDESRPAASRGRGMTRFWDIYESPIGPLTLISSDLGLTGIAFPGRDLKLRTEDHEPALLEPAAEQLEQYFNGERRSFELELDVTGSAFQVSIWQRLLEISHGATISYSQLAEAVDRLDIVRAVAAVVGRTPVPIVIPCHRVVGADGSLTGYGGGLDRKRDLLQLESSGARQLTLL